MLGQLITPLVSSHVSVNGGLATPPSQVSQKLYTTFAAPARTSVDSASKDDATSRAAAAPRGALCTASLSCHEHAANPSKLKSLPALSDADSDVQVQTVTTYFSVSDK